jgi:polysaccharide chain length determinant protein (PEP-CTERM system associated)
MLCALRYASLEVGRVATEKPFEIHDYIQMGLRRKWYIVLPLVASVAVSFGVYKYLPKIYRATTVILVQPQRVPESYVRSTITEEVTGRLNTISQEILSRTRLEQVIHEFNLYPELQGKAPMEGIVDVMRHAVEVKILSRSSWQGGQNSFSISYEGKEPRAVMLVTNELASLFIEENLRVRELQAEKTSDFLGKELQEMEEKLKKKDLDIRNFKERHMGQLPGQLDANLRILEQLQRQVQTTSENIRAAEDRAVLLRSQMDQLRERERLLMARETQRTGVLDGNNLSVERLPDDPLITQWNNLKEELANARTRYTDSHPDVINLSRKLAALESKVKELLEKQKALEEARRRNLGQRREQTAERDFPAAAADPAVERLLAQYSEQYQQLQLQTKRLKAEESNLKDEIALYQKRVEDTPKLEQELILLTRDYDLLRANYQSLLDKKIQAQMAENLERKQQGEQFKVLDPARIPENPVRPDRKKILLMGMFIGLACGLGLAWFREAMDKSFHTVSDVEEYLGLTVVATIPNLREEEKKAA